MKMSKVKCYTCGVQFDKPTKEVTRAHKLGRRHFCCRGHAVTYGNKSSKRIRDGRNLRPDNLRDEFTPFRYYLRRSKASLLRRRCTLSLEFIKELWEQQDGTCPYTGIRMELPASTRGWADGAPPNAASLDRIDSSKGYAPGNVEFVCRFINLGKCDGTREDVRAFIADIRKNT